MKQLKIYCIFILCLGVLPVMGQELNCKIEVNADQVPGTDQRVYKALESTVIDFMNSTAWTKKKFKSHEKIECSFLIRLTGKSGSNYQAELQIVSRRPVFNTSYYTTIVNHMDRDVSFVFTEFDRLYFNPSAYTSNLTSLLAFYAYMIIGLDFESFSKEGGTPYFLEAQKIVSNAQVAPSSGWRASENNRNRYWMIDNLLGPNFTKYRAAFYTYHRKGMDNMGSALPEARAEVLKSLELLKEQNQLEPSSIQLRMFFNSKSDELIDIFSKSFDSERKEARALLQELNPANASKYLDKL